MIKTGKDKNDLMTLFRCACKNTEGNMRELVNEIIQYFFKGAGL